MPDPYLTLGVDRDADLAAIKKAYRFAARACHPDLHGDEPLLLERFAAITAAYELLGDVDRRAFYDRFGQDGAELGLSAEGIREALRAARPRPRPTKSAVAREDCPDCGGTGIRASGRTCTTCHPDVRPGEAAAAAPAWEPSAMDAGRVRMRRPPTPRRPEEQRVRPPDGEDPSTKKGRVRVVENSLLDEATEPTAGRMRLKRKP